MKNRSVSAGIPFLKPIGYAFAVLLAAVFDCTVSPRIGFFGTTPSLSLALVASSAVLDGQKTGAAVGLAAGFCSDALGGVGASVLPLVYALLGWFSAAREHGIPGRDNPYRPFLKRFLNFAVCLILCCGVGAITTALRLILTAGKLNIFSVFLKILLPEALGTFLYGLPLGFIRLASRRSA